MRNVIAMTQPQDGPSEPEPFNDAIARSGVKDECPRCDATDWKVLEGDYAFIKTATDPTAAGGPGIPCAVAICTGCGFVSMHALGALDF